MPCTVGDVYRAGVALLFEEAYDDRDFSDNAPALISHLVAEALPYENAHRVSRGEEKLGSAPVYRGMEDEICLTDCICRVALPLGLAAYYWQDEGNDYRAQDFRARFIDALKGAVPAQEDRIEDEYGY